jgi:hypothetical protein
VDPEVVLLRGGVGPRIAKTLMMTVLSVAFMLGGVAVLIYTPDWKWGLGIVAFFSLGLVFGLPPILRTGKYELTTRRLKWRPYFALSSREVLLASLVPGDIDVDAQTASIALASAKLKMGSLARFEELWGALLLWRELARVELVPGPPLDASSVMWPGEWTVPSVGVVSSFVVVRPDYVAIVPTRFIVRKKFGAAQAAQLVAQVGLALVGVGMVQTSSVVPTHATLTYASHASADYFDALVHRMTALLGGLMVPRDAARVDLQAGPRGMIVSVELGAEGRVHATVDNQLGGFILHVTRPAGLRGPA